MYCFTLVVGWLYDAKNFWRSDVWKQAFVSRVSARPISRTVIERHTEIDGETHRHARNERVIGDVYRQIARHTATDVSRDRETYSSHIKSHRQQHHHRSVMSAGSGVKGRGLGGIPCVCV